jgi:hypothetical protein
MRILSPPRIVETAERLVRVIIGRHLTANKTVGDVREILDNTAIKPLGGCGNVCREGLR